jgi:hypothetical protein
MLGAYGLNVQQNHFNKIYRANTPRAQRKISSYGSDLDVLLRPFGLAQDALCASHLFSDSVIQTSTENFN